MAKPARTETEIDRRARIAAETDAGVAAYGVALAASLDPALAAHALEPSLRQDEHRGLAARLMELRKLVEDSRLLAIREAGQINQRMAQLEQQVTAMGKRVDTEVEGITKRQKELDNALREGGEQVRVAGELGRKMTDQVKQLEELREMASDPHEVIKPLQKSLAFLRGDLEALGRTIDVRFEALPKGRAQPIETRSADEDPIVKQGAEIRKLKERLTALEDA